MRGSVIGKHFGGQETALWFRALAALADDQTWFQHPPGSSLLPQLQFQEIKCSLLSSWMPDTYVVCIHTCRRNIHSCKISNS